MTKRGGGGRRWIQVISRQRELIAEMRREDEEEGVDGEAAAMRKTSDRFEA